MTGFRRSIRALGLAAGLVMLPTLLQAQGTPRRGGTLVVGAAADLQQLNSLVSADGFTSDIVNNVVFMSLLKLTPKLEFTGGLARSWQMIGDTAVVFRLRRNVRWHDGPLTTAHDVAFTLNRALDTLTAFGNASSIEHIQAVQVLDSFTVRLRLKPKRDPLLYLANLAIMPRHLLDSIPPQQMRQAAFNKNPVGNGPFRFVSQRSNDRWVFEANPNYPAELGGRPYVDRFIWRVIPETAAKLTELRIGQIDISIGVPSASVKDVDAEPDLRVLSKPSKAYTMIVWNSKHAPLNQAAVRRALTLGMNRQEMIDLLRAGRGQLATGPVPPSHWAFDAKLAPLPFDTVAARRLLAQAGLVDRNGDGVLESADGKPFEIEVNVATNSQLNRDLGEMVRSQLARIGVRIISRPIDYPTLIANITSPERKFQGAFLSFETDLGLNVADAFHSKALGGPFQSASFSNPQVDRALDRANAARSNAEARTAWHTVQRLLRDDQPWTFLWYSPELFGVNERVKNVTMDLRGMFVELPKWWIATTSRN